MGKVYQNLAHTLPNSNLHHHESNKCHIRGRFSFDVHEHKSTHSALSAFCQLRFSFVFLLSPTIYSGVYSLESCHSRTLHSLSQVGHLAQTSHSGEYLLASRSMLRLSPSASNMHPHRGQMKRTGDFRSFPCLIILIAIVFHLSVPILPLTLRTRLPSVPLMLLRAIEIFYHLRAEVYEVVPPTSIREYLQKLRLSRLQRVLLCPTFDDFDGFGGAAFYIIVARFVAFHVFCYFASPTAHIKCPAHSVSSPDKFNRVHFRPPFPTHPAPSRPGEVLSSIGSPRRCRTGRERNSGDSHTRCE